MFGVRSTQMLVNIYNMWCWRLAPNYWLLSKIQTTLNDSWFNVRLSLNDNVVGRHHHHFCLANTQLYHLQSNTILNKFIANGNLKKTIEVWFIWGNNCHFLAYLFACVFYAIKFFTNLFLSLVLYILTSIWLLHTPNAGRNMLLQCFFVQKRKTNQENCN